MLLNDRLRSIREEKKLSQGDIEKRCGLLRSYISRVEGGHTIPSAETLEKFARALEVPLYQLFYEGKKPPKVLHLSKRKTAEEIPFGHSKKEAQFFNQFGGLLARIKESDRQLLLHLAQKMARR